MRTMVDYCGPGKAYGLTTEGGDEEKGTTDEHR